MEVLGMYLPYGKMYFQPHQLNFFSLGFKLLRFSCSRILAWEGSKISLTTTLFEKNFLQWRFQVCVYLIQKGILAASVKFFFPLGLELPRFSYFPECWFGRDQKLQFNNDKFSKIYSATEVLGMCLPPRKKV